MRYLHTYESYNFQDLKQRVQQAFDAFKEKDAELWDDPRCEIYGNPFSICTNGARWVKHNFFPTAIVIGYSMDENPSAEIGREIFGHDFLLLENRYIIDFWYNVVNGKSDAPIFLDLETDKKLVEKYYGNPDKWTPTGELEDPKFNKDDPFAIY